MSAGAQSLPNLAPTRRAVIWAASASAVMSGAAIAPAVPLMDAALSGAATGWGRVALVLPALVIMLAGPWIGRQTARMDQRKGFVLALCALAGFGVLGGFAPGFVWLLLSRVGLGLATAAVLCFATAAIAALYQGAERAQVINRQSAINTFGGVVFVLLGGLLSQMGWRVPFVLYLLALPVAFFASGFDWKPALRQGTVRPDLAPLKRPLATIALAMTAFYLIPVQAPYMPALSAAPALAGLTIASATLVSGITSWKIAALMEAVPERSVEVAAIGAVILGLVEFGLGASVAALLIAAMLLGAGFGVLLPLTVRRIMAAGRPETANATAGLIASALYAGQVSASALALLVSGGGAGAPFIALAAGLALVVFLYAKRDRLRPWGRWIAQNIA
ncbi:MFS transporter [Primorskyibacter sp. 2E107]|uniref:MFS transporter n=1 Tax=Primorskyibacter sp. 2E107 TaxID=3403458 RepID=UPI003AF7F962